MDDVIVAEGVVACLVVLFLNKIKKNGDVLLYLYIHTTPN